jgi:hypothetical protein
MDKKRKEPVDLRAFITVKKTTTPKTMVDDTADKDQDTICEKCTTKVKPFDKTFHEAFDCPPKNKSKKPQSVVLQDGLVLFRNWLTPQEQQHTIDFCIKMGRPKFQFLEAKFYRRGKSCTRSFIFYQPCGINFFSSRTTDQGEKNKSILLFTF